ncbi:MAG: NAD(P) transhydrogenase subunit alpha [Candidatus Methylacidiphilales bacterium]
MPVAVFPKECPTEPRVALLPEAVALWIRNGFEVHIESGLGSSLHYPDEAYRQSGAIISQDRNSLLGSGDLVLQVGSRPSDEVRVLKEDGLHISFFDPFRQEELLRTFLQHGRNALSMEMMPRSTLAQKMDALSSQANLAGYAAVLLGASELDRILPMMMTPSGTLAPARVFIIGVGVAGLQAIATAKRLGARVEAFDTRPVVEEQVRSLGAKFLKIDLGDTGQTEQGYAKPLTEAQLELQQQGMSKACASSDLVITTAQVFGRTAPRLLKREALMSMRPGAVVVDMAVTTGGNVEGSIADHCTPVGGVKLLAPSNLPGRVARHASQMYGNNLLHLAEHFWKQPAGSLNVNPEDPLLKECLLTWQGEPVSPRIKTLLTKES